MIAALRVLQGRCRFEFAVVDVDDDPDLERRYSAGVPVVAHGGRELCQHVLKAAAVTAYRAGIR